MPPNRASRCCEAEGHPVPASIRLPPWPARSSSPASSRPAASTSATTSARSASTSRGRSAASRRSSASSTCTRSRSPTTRPSCASASYDTTAILLAAGLDPERCILFRQSDVREHTELTWLLSAVTSHGDLNRMTQFKEKSATPARAGLGGALLLPGADGRRRARLPRQRGAGRRRPAPARRADAGDRPPLQRALRRDRWSCRSCGSPRSAPGSWTCRSRSGRCRPPAAPRPAPCSCSTSEKTIRKKVGSAVTDSGREVAPRRGQGRDRQPDRHPRGRPRRRPGGDRGASSRAPATATSRAPSPTAWSSCWRRCASATRELRPDEAALEATLAAGAEKARAIAAPVRRRRARAHGLRPAPK